MKHSPTPWKWGGGWEEIDSGGIEFSRPKYAEMSLFSISGKKIIPLSLDHYSAEWDCPDDCQMPNSDDRAFILRAVNCHDELVAALEHILEWVDNWEPEFTSDEEWIKEEPTFRAALARAKGEE